MSETFSIARYNMVESQLRPNSVNQPALLQIFGNTPRELFVPEASRNFAYIDENIDLQNDRQLLRPMVLARLLQEANVLPTDRVLDVAPGTGYSTAVLSQLAARVTALEPDAALASQASGHLKSLKCDNAIVLKGPVFQGNPAGAPYNVIVLNGKVPQVPSSLLSQLAEGGRLVGLIENSDHPCRAMVFKRAGDYIGSYPLFETHAAFLPNCAPKKTFEFV